MDLPRIDSLQKDLSWFFKGKIQKAESEVVQIEVRLHAPENVNNFEELQKLSEQLVAAECRVQELYDRWAELGELFS